MTGDRYTINAEIVEAIRRELDYLTGGLEFDFRSDYSGRGMYGATCIGFVIDSQSVMALGIAIAHALDEVARLERLRASDDESDVDELAAAFARGVREDSMGLQSIVYFPGIGFGDAPSAAGNPGVDVWRAVVGEPTE